MKKLLFVIFASLAVAVLFGTKAYAQHEVPPGTSSLYCEDNPDVIPCEKLEYWEVRKQTGAENVCCIHGNRGGEPKGEVFEKPLCSQAPNLKPCPRPFVTAKQKCCIPDPSDKSSEPKGTAQKVEKSVKAVKVEKPVKAEQPVKPVKAEKVVKAEKPVKAAKAKPVKEAPKAVKPAPAAKASSK